MKRDPELLPLNPGDHCSELTYDQARELLTIEGKVMDEDKMFLATSMSRFGAIMGENGVLCARSEDRSMYTYDNQFLHHVFLRRTINTFGSATQRKIAKLIAFEERLFSTYRGRTDKKEYLKPGHLRRMSNVIATRIALQKTLK
jgi:hypothetical protein